MAQQIFTLYLLNSRVSTFADAHRIVDPIAVQPIGSVGGEQVEGQALFVQNSNPPSWLKAALPFWGIDVEALYMEPSTTGTNKPTLLNVTNSCLILFKMYDRFFAVTYGPAARWKLPAEDLVDDFGLKVVLNAVEPTKLDKLSTKRIAGGVDFDTYRYASSLVRLEQFGFIASNEYMTVLAGKPEDNQYAVRITGGRGLNVVVNAENFSLDQFIQRTLIYYKSTDYRAKFPIFEEGVEGIVIYLKLRNMQTQRDTVLK